MTWLHRIQNLFEHSAIVLMYHRVADVAVDPWNLAVSPANFKQQIQHLVSKYHVVSAPELLQNLQQKKLASHTVCITFDDGYTDNYLFAKPILEQYNCPATFFIPSQFIGQGQPFWWDELQALLLDAPQLPELFQIPISDEAFEFRLDADAMRTDAQTEKHKHWKWPASPPTRRCELYLKVWEQLKPLPHAEIETAMAEIRNWAGYQPHFSEALLPMRPHQLLELSQNPLFDIGLHTTTHPALAYHAEDVQYWELAENKKALHACHPIPAVAFPYGNYNNSTLAVLQRQRLEAGFTTEMKRLTHDSKLHCLGRFQVADKATPAFENDLRQWLQAR